MDFHIQQTFKNNKDRFRQMLYRIFLNNLNMDKLICLIIMTCQNPDETPVSENHASLTVRITDRR
jgi:hypothetical protein